MKESGAVYVAEREKRRILPRWIVPVVLLLVGAIYLFASGHWVYIYAFFAQFHESSQWALALLAFGPFLIRGFIRSWGVEDIPPIEIALSLGGGRLKPLSERIARSARSPYAQAVLVDHLAHLAAQAVALREGSDTNEIRRQCRSELWNGDDKLRSLICHHVPQGLDSRAFMTWYEDRMNTIESYHRGGTG